MPSANPIQSLVRSHNKFNAASLTSSLGIVVGLAFCKLVVQLLAAGNYGLFIDELYFLATSEHLAWGYVDMPPGAAVLAWIARHMFGESVFGLHLLPALLGFVMMILTGIFVKMLGGGRLAQLLAGLGMFFANIYWLAFSYLSMNALEPLIWMGCALILVRMSQTGERRWWLAFGILAGLGLLNKHTMLGFGFALLAGLLLTPSRKLVWSRWFFLGGGLALLIFLPNLVWNIQQGFPILELQANIRQAGRNVQLSAVQFILEQVILMNPAGLLLWLGGLGWYFFHPQGKAYRFFGWSYLIMLGLLLVTDGRTYYLAPAYPMLFAAGGVLSEGLQKMMNRRSVNWNLVWVSHAFILLLFGVLQTPFYLPILPPETYTAYSKALQLRPPRLEVHDTSVLPQLFADRFGWPEMAAQTAEIYNSLSQKERAAAVILGGNYGQAGTIDFYGPALGLPKAVSGHQNYFLWGPRDQSGEVVITLGYSYSFLARYFNSIQMAAVFQHPYAMSNEFFNIYICRKPIYPLDEVWDQFKNWN